MRHLFFIIALTGILCSSFLSAQDFNYSGAGSLSLGQIKSVEENVFSTMSNPAGTTGISSPGIAISYISPFNLTKLSNRSITGTAPTPLGYFSALYIQSGFSMSLVNRYGISYARKFGKHVAAALEFNGLTHRINETDNYSGFFVTAGIQIMPSDKIILGFYIQNPEQSKISYPDQKVKIPVLYVTGVKWYPLSNLSLMAEMEKDQQFKPQYKFGLEVQPVKVLFLRGGVKGNPMEISFGAGMSLGMVSLDIGISYHQQLGVTSGASLALYWRGKHRKNKEP